MDRDLPRVTSRRERGRERGGEADGLAIELGARFRNEDDDVRSRLARDMEEDVAGARQLQAEEVVLLGRAADQDGMSGRCDVDPGDAPPLIDAGLGMARRWPLATKATPPQRVPPIDRKISAGRAGFLP